MSVTLVDARRLQFSMVVAYKSRAHPAPAPEAHKHPAPLRQVCIRHLALHNARPEAHIRRNPAPIAESRRCHLAYAEAHIRHPALPRECRSRHLVLEPEAHMIHLAQARRRRRFAMLLGAASCHGDLTRQGWSLLAPFLGARTRRCALVLEDHSRPLAPCLPRSPRLPDEIVMLVGAGDFPQQEKR